MQRVAERAFTAVIMTEHNFLKPFYNLVQGPVLSSGVPCHKVTHELVVYMTFITTQDL